MNKRNANIRLGKQKPVVNGIVITHVEQVTHLRKNNQDTVRVYARKSYPSLHRRSWLSPNRTTTRCELPKLRKPVSTTSSIFSKVARWKPVDLLRSSLLNVIMVSYRMCLLWHTYTRGLLRLGLFPTRSID